MFKIKGIYQGRKETIDEFDDKREAERCLTEYRMAYGLGWDLWLEEGEG
jgi:hypothetical protein